MRRPPGRVDGDDRIDRGDRDRWPRRDEQHQHDVGDQQHAGFAHQRDGQAEQAFEQPGTGNEKRRGCAARPGVGEQDEPERAGHRYIGHDDLLWLTMPAR
jgi:hypothetical protein